MTVTTVYHVATETEYVYTLSPDQAVIKAYEQNVNKNYNIGYINPKTYTGYRRTKYGHECNGFWAKA